MSDLPGRAPHFLRVVRGLAKLKGPLPLLAAVTTVVAGVHCGHVDGVVISPCQSDSDCAQGDICRGGVCGAAGVVACTSDTECSAGERCDVSAGFCVDESGTGGSGGAGGAGGAGTGGTAGAGGQGGAGTGGAAGTGGHGGA